VRPFTFATRRRAYPFAGSQLAGPDARPEKWNLTFARKRAATKRRIDAAEGGPEPTLRATTKSLSSKVEIRIRDNGVGISPEFIVTLARQTIE
jgi:hypothetical protein